MYAQDPRTPGQSVHPGSGSILSVTYAKAGFLALLASLVLGAVTGAWFLVVRAVGSLRPEDKAAVLAQSIAEAMNCAALYATVMIPLGLILAYVLRRRRGRLKSQPS